MARGFFPKLLEKALKTGASVSKEFALFNHVVYCSDSTLDIVEFEQRAKLVTLPPNATR